ncbi:MAG: hypothetical protein RSG77_17000 [Hafnia sp.]
MQTASANMLGVSPSIFQRIKNEKLIILAALLAIVAYPLEHTLMSHGKAVAGLATMVLVAAIIATAVRVAHHAEVLAEKVGDPYGTMILTLAAVIVEVVILAIMMSHSSSPTLARDTIYAAVNISLGATLSTVILTVPIIEAIALYKGQAVEMALTPVQGLMVLITLIVAGMNVSDGETNAIEGMTHFVLFATFIMLCFLGL